MTQAAIQANSHGQANLTGWMRGGMLALVLALMACLIPQAQAADDTHLASEVQSTNGAAVLEAFDKQQVLRVTQASELSDHSKRLIMFSMAIPLFILLLITGGLGVATGVFGKKLFIPHMVFAGLTVTMALAHAIVGLVWFYPF
jgi:hypothetical protein